MRCAATAGGVFDFSQYGVKSNGDGRAEETRQGGAVVATAVILASRPFVRYYCCNVVVVAVVG